MSQLNLQSTATQVDDGWSSEIPPTAASNPEETYQILKSELYECIELDRAPFDGRYSQGGIARFNEVKDSIKAHIDDFREIFSQYAT